jgi:hypothetical protein
MTPCVSLELTSFSLQISDYAVLSCLILSTLNMEAIRSFETSVLTRPTRPHIPEDGILHNHLPENLKSYIELTGCAM